MPHRLAVGRQAGGRLRPLMTPRHSSFHYLDVTERKRPRPCSREERWDNHHRRCCTTDNQVNNQHEQAAEEVTGWREEEVTGADLPRSQTHSEETGEVVENPSRRCWPNMKSVGLANHTVLITRWKKIPIADSAALIKDRDGVPRHRQRSSGTLLREKQRMKSSS